MLEAVTWQDVLRMPEDGNRYEAIEGRLCVSPAPARRHQHVVKRLLSELLRILEHPRLGRLYFAPFGLRFPARDEGVQPDLLFVSNGRSAILTDEGVTGAPDLMVEVLSPSTEQVDRGAKLRLYRREGVAEYWIVDPHENFVDAWRFGQDPELTHYRDHLPVRLGGERIDAIDLATIFAPDP